MTSTTTQRSGLSWPSWMPRSPWLLAACGLGLLPLWTTVYPPMVDLAQHAAQVATWQRWGDPSFDYAAHFWVNWRTPAYVVSTSLVLLLSQVFSILVSFKILVSLAILGIPAATWALLRESGGNPSWTFLAVPLGYSFSFYMGFAAFTLAAPLALFFVVMAWRYSRDSTTRRAWILFLFSQLLFFTHTLAFGWAGLTAALLIAAHAPTPWLAVRRWWPLLAGLVLPSAWVLSLLFVENIGEPPVGSSGYGFSRLLQVFTFTVGLPIQDLSLVVGILFFLLPFLTGGRLTRQRARWIPFLTALGIFAITPNFFLGTAFLHQRFTVFLLPTLLFALDVSRPAETSHRRNWLLGLLAFVWLLFIQVQLLGFRYEAGAFGELVEGMEPNRMVLYLPLDRGSKLVPYPVYLHFGSWYQVHKGGIVDYSFAELFPLHFRYRPESLPSLQAEPGPWHPGRFDWDRHDGERYDYFLVHSWRDPSPFFHRARTPVVPVASASGGWWLFANPASLVVATSPGDPPR